MKFKYNLLSSALLSAGLFSSAAQAATVTIDSLTYGTNENGTAYVSNCSESYSGAVTILSSITVDGTDYTVTSIGDYAFSYCNLLTEIIIPDSIASIGDYAFSYCNSLTEIIIPDSVTEIGNYVFQSCSSLSEIVIPEGITEIREGTFDSCSSLTKIIVPEGVTSIGWNAFDSCSSLTEVIIPNSVSSIGLGAFRLSFQRVLLQSEIMLSRTVLL